MSQPNRSTPILIACGLATLCLSVASGSPGDDPPTRCTGVVDMRDIFKRYEKAVRYDQELERQELQMIAEQNRREEEIRNVEGEIGELEAGSHQRTELLSQLVRQKVRLNFYLKKETSRMKQLVLEYTDEVEQDIRKAAKAVADRRGLGVVLNFDPLTDEEDKDLRQRRMPIVLHAHDDVVITEEVLAELASQEGKEEPPGEEAPGEEAPPAKKEPAGSGE